MKQIYVTEKTAREFKRYLEENYSLMISYMASAVAAAAKTQKIVRISEPVAHRNTIQELEKLVGETSGEWRLIQHNSDEYYLCYYEEMYEFEPINEDCVII
jgi:hypothetical protein